MTNHEVRLNTGFGPTAYGVFVGAGLLLTLSLILFGLDLVANPGEVPASVWFPVVAVLVYGPLMILMFRLQAPVTLDLLRGQLSRRNVTVPFSAIDRMQFYTTKNGYGLRFSATDPKFVVRLGLDSTFRAALTAEQWRGIGLLLAGSRVQNVEFSNTGEQFSRTPRSLSRDDALALIGEQQRAMLALPRWNPATPVPSAIRG